MTERDCDDLERRFHDAMLGIYHRAKSELNYNATRFKQMVIRHGGHEAAEILLASNQPSDGFTELFLRGNRLELSVEYLVLEEPWRELFTEEQRLVAHRRLEERGFPPPTP